MINCRGVAVDLRTGEKRPAEPGDLFMKCAGFRPLSTLEEAYDKTPNFARFISDITLKRRDIAQYLMYFLGYSLTGDMREQCYLNFWGAVGKNGKSTLLNLVRHVWGDYCTEAPDSVVLKTKKDDRFDMQFIEGARLIIKADIPRGSWINIGNIKDIIGGDEGFWAEKKYHDGFLFKPKCKIILSSNHRLRLGETGGAMERRLRLMPFQADFRVNGDPLMKEKLDAEGPAILTILIDYARKWYRDGLPVSETVEKYSADYILDEDAVRQFIAERCVKEDGASVQVIALYDAFKIWLKSSKPPSRKDFKDQLAERGYDCRKEARQNENRLKSCFFGLRLLIKGEEKPPEQAELINHDPSMSQIPCSNVPKKTPISKSFL
jgi:putative DNA primase/helicase